MPDLPARAAELLAAIRANPADDAVRQVYADVLAEMGDPRGEFITMQLARAGKKPTKKQEERELALLRAHAASWLGDLAPLVKLEYVSVGPEGTFDRGFLHGISFGGTDKTREQFVAIASHPDLATVKRLTLYENSDPVLEQAELPSLQWLSISADQIETLVSRPAAAHLEDLYLLEQDRGLQFVEDVRSCAKLPALRSLTVLFYRSGLSGATDAAIQVALSFPKLQRLTIHAGPSGTYQRSGKTWTFKNAPGRKIGVKDLMDLRGLIPATAAAPKAKAKRTKKPAKKSKSKPKPKRSR